MSLSSDIKEFALGLGYERVGFTTADPFPVYEKEIRERPQMYDWMLEGNAPILKWANPKNMLPEARSIVVAVFDYFKHSYPEGMVGKVGRCYQSLGSIPAMPIDRARHRLLREFLEKQGCQIGKGPIQLPARLSAARAGATNYGKNCFAFAEGIGSFITVTALVIDAELEYDEPTMEVKCPEKCSLCLDSCPTGALYTPLKMNPHRCIAYNSYATPGSFFGEGLTALPLEIREKMGTWIFGCDICQQVCPRNQSRLKAKLPPNAFLEHITPDFRLETLLNMSDESFDRIQPLLNYIKEKRYFQRNAAVALGNLGKEDAIPTLANAMHDLDELLRGHVAWALGKIGGGKARRILERSLTSETSEYVQTEMKTALN
ncbi:epoxyqueuosine reductase [Chloroflexota bacterium]